MNSAGLVKYAAALMALALCSACALQPGQSGMGVTPSSSTLTIGHIGRMLTVNGRPITAAGPNPALRFSTIVPEQRERIVPDKHARKTFEYIFNYYGTYASIFDYPKSDKQVGEIYGDGGQGCTNVLYGYGKKIFWNVGGQSAITEYQVPNKSIKTLSSPYTFPTSCAMDKSGDLAVGTFFESGKGGGDVLIFKNATGTPTVYTTPLVAEYFDGYDNHGNLFADGYTNYGFGLVELPKGSSTFETITTSNSVGFPGSVQWDGKYLTVFDQYASETYRYKIHGTNAVLQNTISYTGVGDCAQTWIATGVIYCGDNSYGGEVFDYPAGGSPIAKFKGNFVGPLGVVAAEK